MRGRRRRHQTLGNTLNCEERPVPEPEVEQRALTDYDDALGINENDNTNVDVTDGTVA
jgi:hypothetical protein